MYSPISFFPPVDPPQGQTCVFYIDLISIKQQCAKGYYDYTHLRKSYNELLEAIDNRLTSEWNKIQFSAIYHIDVNQHYRNILVPVYLQSGTKYRLDADMLEQQIARFNLDDFIKIIYDGYDRIEYICDEVHNLIDAHYKTPEDIGLLVNRRDNLTKHDMDVMDALIEYVNGTSKNKRIDLIDDDVVYAYNRFDLFAISSNIKPDKPSPYPDADEAWLNRWANVCM